MKRREPGSLARLARQEKARLVTESRYARLRRERLAPLASLARDEFSFLWLFPLAFGIPFIPWNVHFRPFADTSRAVNFLQTLWQVQGAALGLSLAVVLFVFQAVYGVRLGGSLREFAEETWLFPIFYVGLYGLGLDGLVLLGGGAGASGGWAATWAVCWAAATSALLLFLFVFTVRAIDPRALHRRRLARSNAEIERETERVIFRRVALVVLDRFCQQQSIEFVPVFGQAPSHTAVAVRAPREGVVH
jgi:hypothetical protein